MLWRISLDLGKLYQIQRRHEEAEFNFSTSRGIIEELAANIPDESLRGHFLSCATAQFPRPHPLSPRRVAKKAFGGLTERERAGVPCRWDACLADAGQARMLPDYREDGAERPPGSTPGSQGEFHKLSLSSRL